MAEREKRTPDLPSDDAYLRVCEGILRTEFGRKRFSAASRAIQAIEARGEMPSRSTLIQKWRELWLIVRPRWAWAVPAVAALILTGTLLLFWQPVDPLPIGRVVVVVGEPHMGEAERLQVAEAGAPVHSGWRIETGDADRLEIQFNDGTTLHLQFNTVVQIPRVAGDRNVAARLTRPPEIQLVEGQVWTVVQKSTNGTPYAIRTDAATALARGTEFGVKVDRPLQFQSTSAGNDGRTNATVLTVREGTVEFFNAFGSVEATAMTESTARAGFAPTEPRRLQTLQAVRVAGGEPWSIQTAALKPPEAAGKLAGGGYVSGLQLRDLPRAGGGEALGQPADEIRVVRVQEQSPAERAGIEVGDVLETIDGQPVLRAGQAEQMLLARSSAILNVRRHEILEELDLALSRANPVLPGPSLTEEDQTKLVALFQQWVSDINAAALEKRRLDDAARISPAHLTRAGAFNNLGVFLELDDQLGPAVRAYGRAVYLDRESALYRLNLGLALRKIGSYERAYEELLAALSLVPDSSLLQTRVAELEALVGATSEALARVEAGLEWDPESHNLWELKAQLQWRAGQLEPARAAAEQAVTLEPGCVVGHAYLGGVLRELGRLEEAEVALRTALGIDPFNAWLHVEMGSLQQARGALVPAEQAEWFYRKALELSPADPTAYLKLAGILKEKPGQIREAEELYLKAIEMSPNSSGPLSDLAELLARTGRAAEAEPLIRRALELAPDSARMCNNLGEILRQRGKLDEAETLYRRALQLDPNLPSAMNNLGILLIERKQFRQAEELYREMLRRGTDAPPRAMLPVLVNLAIACEEQGKVDEAETLFREALAIAPGEPRIRMPFAEFLANNRRQLDEAAQLADTAVVAMPGNPQALNTLGFVHLQRGELELAAEALNRALAIAGNEPPSQEVRERLEQVKEARRSQNR